MSLGHYLLEIVADDFLLDLWIVSAGTGYPGLLFRVSVQHAHFDLLVKGKVHIFGVRYRGEAALVHNGVVVGGKLASIRLLNAAKEVFALTLLETKA